MNVQNRGSSGSGHGWSGMQIMFWNSVANRWRAHAPNGAMNWAIGMIGEKGGFLSNRIPEPDGIIQSMGTAVTPRSLYYTQLQERLGANALRTLLPSQKLGHIWTDLGAWMGNGLFGDTVVAWLDEDAVPVATGVSLDIGGTVRDLNLLGNSPTYAWSLSTGPGGVTFGDSASLETTASFDAGGTYTLELLVSDGTTTETASLVVLVEGTPPQPTTATPTTSAPTTQAPTTATPTTATPTTAAPTTAAPTTVAPATAAPTEACNNDSTCDTGETCTTCSGDCPSGSIPGVECGNGVCETADGESCLSCPQDCNGVQGGKPSNRYCCGDGNTGNDAVDCTDSRCGGSSQCLSAPAPPGGSYCCGNGSCEVGEDSINCAVDCPLQPTLAPTNAPTPAPVIPTTPPTNPPTPSCAVVGAACSADPECCSNKCKGGKCKN